MMHHGASALRSVLKVGELEDRVRPRLRPAGVLAASFLITGLASATVGWLASVLFGRMAYHPAQMFSGGAGKAISVALILAMAADDFQLNRLVPGTWRWWAIPGGLVTAVGLFLLELVIEPPPSGIEGLTVVVRMLDISGVVLMLLCAVAFAIGGASEELLFRGMIQTSAERYFRPSSASVVTAVLFAAPHVFLGWIPATELFFVSLAFSWYRRRSGSLLLPIVAHASHNALYAVTLVLTS